MKLSDELRRETYRQLIDWRMYCNKIKLTTLPTDIKPAGEYVSYAATQRLLHAYNPVFASLTRIETLLSSLKYIAILMVLWGSNCESREYRHVRHHSHSVERSVFVYEPPRVEPRKVPSAFEVAHDGFDFPNLDMSRLLRLLDPKPSSAAPEPEQVVTVVEVYHPHNPFELGRVLIALGSVLLLCTITLRVTGRYGGATPADWTGYPRGRVCTLVERKSWLPETMSLGWLHVKHYLRLR